MEVPTSVLLGVAVHVEGGSFSGDVRLLARQTECWRVVFKLFSRLQTF